MGEMVSNCWPFKPLVAGSIPAALTNPHAWGFYLYNLPPTYLDAGWNVINILNSNVLTFFILDLQSPLTSG